jgi:hypothetical protein
MAVVITIIIVAVLAIAGLAWQAARRRNLQRRFGPEYERVVAEQPNRAAAEHELRAREQRHSELDLREMSPQDTRRYTEQWAQVQALFVEDPARAVSSADELVTHVMHDLGYPLGGFDDRVRALSVEHAHTLDQYRQGHAISQANERGEASTEQLRQGFMHYRALAADLLGAGDMPAGGSATDNFHTERQTR